MKIELKNADKQILYSVLKSDLFPDYCSVLREAIAYGIDLTGLSVENENIDNTILRGVNLTGISFHKCSLKKVEFVKSNIDGLYFYDCDLNKIKFKNSEISNLHVDNSDLRNSRFRFTNTGYAFIIGCNLSKSEFFHCRLDNIAFHTCNLFGVIFNNSSLCESQFIHTSKDDKWMQDVHFDYCKMDQCDLTFLSNISVLFIKESNIQASFSNNEHFTKILNSETTVLYAIDSDIVWWDSFRGSLDSFKHEIENNFPTTGIYAPEDIFFYNELSKVCIYLDKWKKEIG